MSVLITGVGGFIGNHLYHYLSNNGHEVIGIYNKTKPINSLPSNQIINLEQVDNLLLDPKIVILSHACIESGLEKKQLSDLFNSNVLTTSKFVSKFPNAYFIYLSSVSVYGDFTNKISEETLPNPQNNYGISKLWGEMVVRNSTSHGILRITSVFGRNMKENTIIPTYVNQALNHKNIDVWGDGSRIQNYIHLNEICLFISKMIDSRAQGIFLGASKNEYSNLQLAEIIANFTSSNILFKNTDQSKSYKFDSEQSYKKLGINFSSSSFKNELLDYINWKRKQY
jgi:nucleoside-diphosphate-sugar epimerase